MGSVFTGSITKVLERVNKQAVAPPEQQSKEASEFTRVLGDIAKRPVNQAAAQPEQVLAPPAALKESELLSNLTLGEQTTFPSLASTTHSRTGLANSTPIPASALLPVRVAPPDLSVKIPSPVPSMPEIISAKRTQVLDYGKVSLAEPRLPRAKEPDSRANNIRDIIHQTGKRHGVDPNLSFAVAKAESALRPDAVSRDGKSSKGLFQLLDTTAHDMMKRLGQEVMYKPFDPKQNSDIGIAYLRRLHDLFSTESNLGWKLKTEPARSAADLEKLAVAAFNAGEGRVARAQAKAKALGKDPSEYSAIEPHLPSSTQAYVRRVLDYRVALVDRKDIDETV